MHPPILHKTRTAVRCLAVACVSGLILSVGPAVEAEKSAWEGMTERPVYAPSPILPKEASANHWSGTGIFTLHLWADGTVKQVQVTRSTGHAALDKAAVDALRKWRYGPGLPGSVNVPVTFEAK